jgi:hypothetical protein
MILDRYLLGWSLRDGRISVHYPAGSGHGAPFDVHDDIVRAIRTREPTDAGEAERFALVRRLLDEGGASIAT